MAKFKELTLDEINELGEIEQMQYLTKLIQHKFNLTQDEAIRFQVWESMNSRLLNPIKTFQDSNRNVLAFTLAQSKHDKYYVKNVTSLMKKDPAADETVRGLLLSSSDLGTLKEAKCCLAWLSLIDAKGILPGRQTKKAMLNRVKIWKRARISS